MLSRQLANLNVGASVCCGSFDPALSKHDKREEGAIEAGCTFPHVVVRHSHTMHVKANRRHFTPSRRRTLPTPGPRPLDLLVSLSGLVKTAGNRLVWRQLSIDSLFVDFVQNKVTQFPFSPPLDQPQC